MVVSLCYQCLWFHQYQLLDLISDIENTRLVLNIAQVYPARLRKACRVILDFQAEQDKLELYSTLILVFYLSYHFNG